MIESDEPGIEHVLHVLARNTGRELDPVFLYELPLTKRGSTNDRHHPGPQANERGHEIGPSPVKVDALEGDWRSPRVFYAKSPGYAWGRTEILSASPETTLMLDPAGELELFVRGQGEAWEPGVEVEVFISTTTSSKEFLDARLGSTKAFLIEDLPAGHYTAQARSYGILAGEVEVEVTAGERVKATLDLGGPESSFVPCQGVLVLSSEWKLDDFWLDFELRSRQENWDSSLTNGHVRIRRAEMTLEDGSRDQFGWSASLLQSARYTVILQGIFAMELDTGPAGTREARIEVPPPGQVTLRCVDEWNGAEVESETVSFAACAPRVFGVQSFATLTGGARANPWRFSIPQGAVLVFTRPNLYEQAARVLTVGPGENKVLLRLRPRAENASESMER